MYIHIYIILYIILVTGMAFTNCNSHLDLLFQKGIRYEHHQKDFREILPNGITPFGLRIQKAPGIVTATEDFHIKSNEILKGTGSWIRKCYSDLNCLPTARGRQFNKCKLSRQC